MCENDLKWLQDFQNKRQIIHLLNNRLIISHLCTWRWVMNYSSSSVSKPQASKANINTLLTPKNKTGNIKNTIKAASLSGSLGWSLIIQIYLQSRHRKSCNRPRICNLILFFGASQDTETPPSVLSNKPSMLGFFSLAGLKLIHSSQPT